MQNVTIEQRPPLRLARLDTGGRNVLTLAAVRELRAAIVPDSGCSVLVLSGRDDGFCSGLDNRVLAGDAGEREELLAAMGDLLLAAFAGPMRIVAACGGHAVAAGAMLLLVSDLRIGATGRYKIGFTEPSLGMPLPEFPALLARERLDRFRLHELTALGRTLGPDEAAAVGFLDTLVDRDALQTTALERARELATLSEAAYVGTVAAVRRSALERLRVLVDEQARRLDRVRR
jgi:enoyl-CoA hydratase